MRKLLRERKQQAFDELMEWEADLQQIRASIESMLESHGQTTNEGRQRGPEKPELPPGEIFREGLIRSMHQHRRRSY
jgi:hypothetical protein